MDNELKIAFYLQDNRLLISGNILKRLESPRQLQILINSAERLLVIRSCGLNDKNAIVVTPLRKDGFAISARSLFMTVRKATGWDDDQVRFVYGDYNEENNFILFDLNCAVPTENTV